jgi:hypothetical protein
VCYRTFSNSLCSDGCLQCQPSSEPCSTCEWSDWSPYGVCSDKCNGTQTRYRSRSCLGSPTQIDYENQTCSTDENFYEQGCSICSCDTITGQETCRNECGITPDVCSNMTNDPLFTYEYVPAMDGQCCGTCERKNSMYSIYTR